MQVQSISKIDAEESVIYIGDQQTDWKQFPFSEKEIQYIDQQIAQKNHFISFNDCGHIRIVAYVSTENIDFKLVEAVRKLGAKASPLLNQHKVESVNITHNTQYTDAAVAFAEGLLLANYQFLKYKKEADKEKNSLQTVLIPEDCANAKALEELQNVVKATCEARDLVNEPLSFLTARQLSEEIKRLGKEAKFKVKVFGKKKIQNLKMGGLLAVNLGSFEPPTFSILEWKPKNAINKKPIVLVGKGVVYDTGGLSLKKTANGMDHMKCDMAGSAAVIGATYAVAKNKLPLHVVTLVPATDNRPGKEAYVPGDVITMYNGMTVEVMNTDAEGRMLLADALSYATKYDPELVIDVATLTGSSLVTLGTEGMLLFGTADGTVKDSIKKSSFEVYERLVELPLWDEYKESLKSTIADTRNIGKGPFGGSITAAKFLEQFTDFPWLHIDMATMGWNYQPHGYRVPNGAGTTVRLLYHFLKERSKG